MTDVYTAALLPTKPLIDDDSGFRHGFRAEASLPLTQNTPAVTHSTTRLCWIDISLWDGHTHTDAVRALSWICFMYLPLSDGESLRLVEVELVMKPWHLTLIRNMLIIQPFYSMPSCLTLSIIRYGSKVKWGKLKKGVAPFPTPSCSSY